MNYRQKIAEEVKNCEKMKNKPLLGLCILLLLASAPALSEETNSVSRIVGDSPSEMLRQLQREEIDLRHATYYTHDQLSDKDNILREQFGNNVEIGT